MPTRIVPRRPTESNADFHRRMAGVMARRASEQLRTGRNPEQAAMLAAEYTQRAQALESSEVVTR